MGSPNFGGNSKGIDVPMYAVEYSVYDELEDGILETWIYDNDIDPQVIIDECGIDPFKVKYNEIDELEKWALDNGYSNPRDFAEEEHQSHMDSEYENGKYAEIAVNKLLDTELLYVTVKSGYWEGYCVLTESPYWDSEIYDINYEWIAEDYEISVEEARDLFDMQVNDANFMLKSEFGGIGWKPHSGGYTGSFYEV